jgi:hypothetical protein
MPIPVICPGCNTAFRVSDKFAGQTGPCPKCKALIKIPAAAAAEVKIHGPDAGPKDAKGRVVFKPIRRLDVTISNNVWLIGGGSALVVMLAAWLLGAGLRGPGGVPDTKAYVLRAIGMLIVLPGLSLAGYFFLRNREKLDVFTGKSLWLRTAICAACYLAIWAGYAYVRARYNMPAEVWQLFIILPPMLVLGAIAALGSYELDFGSAFLHCCFQVLVIVWLAYLAGMKMWPAMTIT